MKNTRKLNFVIVLIIVGAAIFFLSSPNEIATTIPPNMVSVLSTDGFVQVQPSAEINPTSGQGLIALTGNCYQVTGNTDNIQAQSIIDGLAGKIAANGRPNTQDLMKDTFQNFGIKVLMVKVIGIQNNNFIGRLILQQGNKILSLDSRPSDGIALAVRVDAPVYFNQTLMQQYGEKIC